MLTQIALNFSTDHTKHIQMIMEGGALAPDLWYFCPMPLREQSTLGNFTQPHSPIGNAMQDGSSGVTRGKQGRSQWLCQDGEAQVGLLLKAQKPCC